ncbi:MAG: hypothetical protein U5L02_18960 [Rheinheimera sp.]|nr:hypothetical protein [Rheinheimera sp.]
MVRSELTSTTTASLLEQLAGLDRKNQARLLQQIRAELALRGVRYREQQIPATQPPQYLIVQTVSNTPAQLSSPLVDSGSQDSYGSPWWVSVLLVLVMSLVLLLLQLFNSMFQPVNACYGICIAVFLLLAEAWLLHSRQHQHYLARWLAEQYPPLPAYKQRAILYCFAVLFGFSLTGTFSWLGHQASAQPVQQQVLLLDMRRDYDSGCKFRLLLQFGSNHYRYLCIKNEQQYDDLRPNDQVMFRGNWSWFGISGQVQSLQTVNAGRQ